MKKLFVLAAALLFGCLGYQKASAQLHVSLGINISSQPDWGPIGYDHADYYFLPDIDTYYDVTNHQFIYLDGNTWVRRTALPPRYSNYDLYHGYKVVVNAKSPWRNNTTYRNRYSKYRGKHDQQVIRDSHESKYKNHWNPANKGHHSVIPSRGRSDDHHDDKGHANKGNDGHRH